MSGSLHELIGLVYFDTDVCLKVREHMVTKAASSSF